MANRRRRAWSLLWRSSVAALYVVGLILAVQVTHPAPDSSSSVGAVQAAVSWPVREPMATASLEQRPVAASVEELPIVTLAIAVGLMATAGTGWAVHRARIRHRATEPAVARRAAGRQAGRRAMQTG